MSYHTLIDDHDGTVTRTDSGDVDFGIDTESDRSLSSKIGVSHRGIESVIDADGSIGVKRVEPLKSAV